MAKNTLRKQTLTYLLGVCVPSSKQNAAKIRIRRMDFDDHLLTYFTKYEFVYAADTKKCCKTGDTVLIQNLPDKLTRVITHKVVDVIYPLGDIIDPVTGKKVVVGKYRDTVHEDAKLFGELKSMYQHDELPKRGSMENKRDFTSKKVYVKHNKDAQDSDPYAVDPL
ncbi:28S ribosomal protein S17, mitochondrial [Habropoda laboriosa]|uniref:28S ribosomal protein S17, mitochondrial n=1 Tax=Habropoda laboriosa TaxID=597456 RepID=A0A0L7R883_9HYME|nr:PREDICTED: 28S ribosomal protein S17, mitochondrial [Habropoda laboriosa]KOC66966.1 28S ribosomal protein S17, mitochondrial [Habropoda laboriosa]